MSAATSMSLLNLLEGCKDVALAAREELAAKAAEDVAEFEEFGEDIVRRARAKAAARTRSSTLFSRRHSRECNLDVCFQAAALDAEELAAEEEALRLAQEMDDREEEEQSEREREDLEIARKMIAADEESVAACDKDELIAQQLEAQLKQEAVRVAKLEKRERKLTEKKLTKGDIAMAEQLAADIENEEAQLRELERKDRLLARQLVKEEGKALAALPQTEEKLKGLATSINGDSHLPMRTRMLAKLGSMRKGMLDITNNVQQTCST